MRDVFAQLHQWFDSEEDFVLATVMRTWHSAPRAPGAAMAVSASGEVVGSVSGGCIESALYTIAEDALLDRQTRVETFQVSDADALDVGLTCGGTIEILVQVIGADYPEFAKVCRSIAADRPVAVVTTVRPGAASSHLVVEPDSATGALADRVRTMMAVGDSGASFFPAGVLSDDDLFVEIFAPKPRMYVFGAIDFAASVSTLGAFAGYHVTVVDARAVFATRARFPAAHELVVMWPHTFLQDAAVDARTVIAVLTHDEKFDIPLLEVALRSGAGYVGAMGSRATHDRRVRLLRDRGITDEQLAQLHSPIGLDLGARNPEETAISVMAEVTKTMRAASGRELRELNGPIHPLRNDAAVRSPAF